MTDPLSELLAIAGAQGSLISRARLRAPWGVSCGDLPMAVFHTPQRGTTAIALASGGPAERISPGDVAVLPRGSAHLVMDEAGRRCRPIGGFETDRSPNRLTTVTAGGDGAELDLLCGSFTLGEPARGWLLAPLPDLFVVRGAHSATSFVRATLELMEAEVAGRALGSRIVSDRLVEVLVVHLLRAWSEEQGGQGVGWLAGLGDPHLGPLMVSVHSEPTGDWSLAKMAQRAGLSRTRFVARFRERIGVPPGAWMTEWRIALASHALREGADVAGAAERAGYASEASFSRAFKRVVGQSPGAWRTSGTMPGGRAHDLAPRARLGGAGGLQRG